MWHPRDASEPTPDHICPLCGGPKGFLAELQLIDGVVYHRGTRLKFSKSESEILGIFIKRLGRVVTKESLWILLYGHLPNAEPDPKIIDVFVCKIRKKLAAHKIPVAIDNIWGRGWMIRELPREQANPT